MAFCICRRFSAWSKRIARSESRTAWDTSSPGCWHTMHEDRFFFGSLKMASFTWYGFIATSRAWLSASATHTYPDIRIDDICPSRCMSRICGEGPGQGNMILLEKSLNLLARLKLFWSAKRDPYQTWLRLKSTNSPCCRMCLHRKPTFSLQSFIGIGSC